MNKELLAAKRRQRRTQAAMRKTASSYAERLQAVMLYGSVGKYGRFWP